MAQFSYIIKNRASFLIGRKYLVIKCLLSILEEEEKVRGEDAYVICVYENVMVKPLNLSSLKRMLGKVNLTRYLNYLWLAY